MIVELKKHVMTTFWHVWQIFAVVLIKTKYIAASV